MTYFLQQLVSGLATGGIFASLALALVLIYNAMGLVNFAQGEMAMFATFISYSLIEYAHLDFWSAFVITIADLLRAGGGDRAPGGAAFRARPATERWSS